MSVDLRPSSHWQSLISQSFTHFMYTLPGHKSIESERASGVRMWQTEQDAEVSQAEQTA